MLALVDHVLTRLHVLFKHAAKQRHATACMKLLLHRMHTGRHWRDKWIGINLSMRMMQCHADFSTAVLESEDVPNVATTRDADGAVGPDLH
jgi:hypothetical protein